MNICARQCFTVFVVSLLFAGCSDPPHTTPTVVPDTKPEGARLPTAEVTRIANQAAERQGVDLRQYKEPRAHYELTRKDKSWSVFFDGRVARPGNHFSVSVDDQTGETRFFGGK
jgi:hypothetical protein